MKSRISFFNRAVFKKDVTRFAPLWVLYTLAILLMMLTSLSGTYYGHPVHTVNDMLTGLPVLNMLYAALAAQLLFGDLFKAQMCNALHAMPMTREARFGSHLLAGLGFSLLPNLLTALLMMIYLQNFWYVSLLWLGAMTLQYLFFFGVGVLSVQLTGNRFAMVVVYAILNLGAVVAMWFAETVFLPMMPGVMLNEDTFLPFSPLIQLIRNGDYFSINWYDVGGVHIPWQNAQFRGLGETWEYVLICAGIGVVAMVISFLLYRRRALECAGDFIAVKGIAPVFLVLYTLCAGAFLAIFGSMFIGDTYLIFLIVGLVVGFFTGKMLLERTSKVFRKKSFLHLAILTAVLLICVGLAKWDVFGVVKYVPDAEDVASITIQNPYAERYTLELTRPAHIQTTCNAHALAMQEDCTSCGQGHRYFTVTYHMRDGRTVIRRYRICNGGEAAKLLQTLPKYVAK